MIVTTEHDDPKPKSGKDIWGVPGADELPVLWQSLMNAVQRPVRYMHFPYILRFHERARCLHAWWLPWAVPLESREANQMQSKCKFLWKPNLSCLPQCSWDVSITKDQGTQVCVHIHTASTAGLSMSSVVSVFRNVLQQTKGWLKKVPTEKSACSAKRLLLSVCYICS